jgi:SEC-C motif-containing protein
MRSRYTAYTLHEINYLRETLSPDSRDDFDEKATRDWATQTEWKKLTILSTKKGLAEDQKGTVEFSAHFKYNGDDLQLHEVSQFKKDKDGRWFYVDGEAHTHPANDNIEEAHQKPETFIRSSAKVGRNDPCSCGSGKKFKRCCGK